MAFLCHCAFDLNIALQESQKLLSVSSESSSALDMPVKRGLTGFLSIYH